jgi:YVTN family beta-propeller protein
VLVANQQSGSASLIDLTNDTARVIPVGSGPHEAVIAPSGRIAVVTIYGLAGAPGNQLAVVDIAKGAVTNTISLGRYTRPHGAMFLPGDETRVAVTSEATQNVVIVNIAEGKVESAIPTGAAGSHMVAITADGKRAFTSDIGTGAVSEIDLVSKSLLHVIPVAPRVEGVAVTPDGSAVWAGSNTNGTVSVIDTKTGLVVETLTGFKLPYRLAMSADGRTAIICDPQADRLHVADVAQRKVTWTLDALGSPRCQHRA